MANMIMASSSKTLITSPSIQSTPKFQLPQFTTLRIRSQANQTSSSNKIKTPTLNPNSLKSTAAIAAAVLTMAPPSLAAEIEKAALFDFNLTLPLIMAEFLILMFALDKIYYSPLGNFMDARDADIRGKLNSVKDTSSEVKELDEQAAAIMRAARAEIAAALNQMKKETTVEVEAQMAEGRKKLEAELAEALGNLENQKEETIKALDSQIAALSDEIVKKVLPV
ncbi:ATP synthase subunit b', chloroplastic-like [Papaver somniferum]|uniref:ATP synthase subunit b', chloroplastic-like n=1 Tax=Papaver somniferum TaxID=3469 RepID=UPI000E700E1B|nr:ATP synthase subunit b', chloroplastic-like [Papaver somniferum]